MADNITVSDANDVDRVLRTTDTASVHTPHHIVESSALPTGAATSALQTAGNTSLATIAGAVSGTEVQVDIVGLGSSGAATATNQATGNGHLATLAGAVTGTEMQVDLVGSLPAGSNAIGTVALGAGTAEIGKLAAGTASIGTVILGAGTAEIGKLAAGTAAIGKLAANSGVDIGDVDVTSVAIPTAVKHGYKTVASAGTALAIGSSQAITSGVTVKAYAANSGLVFVGDSTVTNASGAYKGFELSAKESVFIEVDNVNKVYVDAASSSDGVCWIAS